jgi:dTDP-4-dehydrorhamnose 3,5-epimerase-like enzyme
VDGIIISRQNLQEQEQPVEPKVRVSEVPDSGDRRGSSFTLPPEALEFVGAVRDVHMASMVPGAVRGNHYHTRRREAIVVLNESPWSLYWDEGEGTTVEQLSFEGEGATLILVSPGASHALRNDGESEMSIVAFSSEEYDPAETVARKLVG